MKTQLHQQKSEDLQGNWSVFFFFFFKDIILQSWSKNHYSEQCDVKKALLSATLCTDLQSIS